MRVLFILLSVLLYQISAAQINMSGAKDFKEGATSSTGTQNSKEVVVTKSKVEPSHSVVLNRIPNSTIEPTLHGVRISITRNGASTYLQKPGYNEGEMNYEDLRKLIVIDLGDPKITRAPQDAQGRPIFLTPQNGQIPKPSGIVVVPKGNPVELVTSPTEIKKDPVEVVVEPVVPTPAPIEIIQPDPIKQPEIIQPDPVEVVTRTPITTTPTISTPIVKTPTITEYEIVTPQPVVPKAKEITSPQPVVTQPVITQPVVTQPVVTQPVVTQPVVTQPVVTQPMVPVTTSPSAVVVDTPMINVNPSTPSGIQISQPSVDPLTDNSESGDETMPAKKKPSKTLAVGFHVGLPLVIGDVNRKAGFGGGITLQKPIGHVFSLRFQTLFAETYGRDWKLQPGQTDYKNYKSRLTDYTLQGVFSINNLNFYKRQPKVILNLIAGAGFSTRISWNNLVDENGNAYDYSGVPVIIDRANRSDAIDAIDNLIDNSYETVQANNTLEAHIKSTDINPAIVFGAGLAFRLGKKVDLNIEERISWHNDDNMDGYAGGNGNDWLSYTSVGLNFKFGKSSEAMWFSNPVHANYDDIHNLKKRVKENDFLTDEDEDGVADVFDNELNTPPKVPVDSRGVASDLDKDGIPDYEDAEPFTPIGADVDKNGVAIDSDGDGVPDVYDMEMLTPSGAYVDANGREIKGGFAGANGSNGTSGSVGSYIGPSNNAGKYNVSSEGFGMVFFDLNSTNIKKEFYPELYKVVAFLRDNPSRKVIVTGHTDLRSTEAYNMGLSEKRATEAYRMLTEVFKVLSTKLEVNYVGEGDALVPNLPDPANPKYESAYYLNRRVTFNIK